MSVTPSPIGGFAAQFFDNNGVILSGGKIYTYAAGTTTPQATYTSASGVTPHANPIILDSAGRVPSGEIWLTDGLVYKFVIETATGILLGTYDNITGVNSNFVNYTVQEEVITATAGQTVFNLSTINYTPGTNSLTVYIDGVNQYVGDSYLETDSNTVTFTSGVHVGGEVKFTTAIQTTTGAVDASIVSYEPPFTGGVATNVEDKLAQYVSVKDFGAVGDGVADDTAAIQDALDYFVTAATPGQVLFPSGTYKCTTTLDVNAGYVSCIGDRAALDFSTIGNIPAVQFSGGNAVSGQPYNQADCVFSGFNITGPSTLIAAGLLFETPSSPGPAHMTVRDCVITNFNNGITFFDNAYLITIEHCDIWGCYRCVYMPAGSTNAGENIRFNNCTLFNSDEGFKCEQGSTTFNFVGTSFDGLLTSVILTAGQANFTGCHFEYVTVANTALDIAANCIVTCTGCFFLNTFASQDKYIDNAGFLSIYGGRISVADTATNVVYSTSRLTMLGCHIQSATTTPVTVASGNSLVYLPNTGVLQNSSAITGSSVAATNGTFVGGKTVTLSTLNTWVSLGVGTANGLFTFRDGTSNGTAVFAADVGAQTSIQNNITGFEMNYGGVAGQMSVRVTSGTTPRSINFSLLQTGV